MRLKMSVDREVGEEAVVVSLMLHANSYRFVMVGSGAEQAGALSPAVCTSATLTPLLPPVIMH